MNAIVLDAYGDPTAFRRAQRPVPAFARDQMLVRVRACGVCGHDLLARRGVLGTPLPAVLGHEIAGEVERVGSRVRSFVPGDRVALVQRIPCRRCRFCRAGLMNLCRSGPGFYGEGLPGGYAEFVIASEGNAVHLPVGVPFEQGAILSCAVGTGWRALRRARARRGNVVLITGASGGVGIHAVQLAHRIGAHVIAVTSSPAKERALREGGADDVIVAAPGEADLRAEVARITGGPGADVVLEVAGPPTFAASLRALAPHGRLVVIGNLEPRDVAFPPGLVILKELSIIGSAHATRADLEQVVELVASGAVRPVVSEVLPMEAACRAHEQLEQRAIFGRQVLVPAWAA